MRILPAPLPPSNPTLLPLRLLSLHLFRFVVLASASPLYELHGLLLKVAFGRLTTILEYHPTLPSGSLDDRIFRTRTATNTGVRGYTL